LFGHASSCSEFALRAVDRFKSSLGADRQA
jgi:hypothetical protein